MATGQIHIVVNPASAGGRTARRWPQMLAKLTEKLGPVTYTFTDAPGDGSAKARAALDAGATLLIVVGGDGSFSEAVDGCFEEGKPLNPNMDFALITSGTGCDIRRLHGWPEAKDFSAMIDLIAESPAREVDLGHLTYTDLIGETKERHFVNIASFGVGGAVSHAVNTSRIAKKFGGSFTFMFHALREALRFKNQRVRVEVDESLDETFEMILGAAAIGSHFGGGLNVAPEADPADGLFDILVGHDITKGEIPGLFARIYSGKHIHDPKVKCLRGKRLVATPVDPDEAVYLEVDGESPGMLRAEFTCLPGVLRLRG